MKFARGIVSNIYFVLIAVFAVASAAFSLTGHGIVGGICAFMVIAAAFALFLQWRRTRKLINDLLPEPIREDFTGLPPEKASVTLAERYAELYKEQEQNKRRRFLENIVTDNSHTKLMENFSEKLEILSRDGLMHYKWKRFCLIYVSFQEFSSFILECGSVSFNDFRKVYNSVSETFERLANERHIGTCIEYRRDCICLVNLRDDADDEPDSLVEACRKAVDDIRAEIGLPLMVAVSDPYDDISDTYKTREWMSTMLEYYRFVGGECSVISSKQLTGLIQSNDGDTSHTDLEKRYYNAVILQDIPAIRSLFYEIIREQSALHSIDGISALKNSTRMRLESLTDILGIDHEPGTPIGDAIIAVNDAETIDTLLEECRRAFDYIAARQSLQSDEYTGTVKLIIDYIDKNYALPSLTVMQVAEALNLNQSYVSRLFKKETGEGPLDYMHKVRVKEAKRLLMETNMSINDISAAVGYTTTWTMNRAFKRFEGCPPGAFREICRAGSADSQK